MWITFITFCSGLIFGIYTRKNRQVENEILYATPHWTYMESRMGIWKSTCIPLFLNVRPTNTQAFYFHGYNTFQIFLLVLEIKYSVLLFDLPSYIRAFCMDGALSFSLTRSHSQHSHTILFFLLASLKRRKKRVKKILKNKHSRSVKKQTSPLWLFSL